MKKILVGVVLAVLSVSVFGQEGGRPGGRDLRRPRPRLPAPQRGAALLGEARARVMPPAAGRCPRRLAAPARASPRPNGAPRSLAKHAQGLCPRPLAGARGRWPPAWVDREGGKWETTNVMSMLEKAEQARVKGVLRAQGTRLVNGDGEEVLLTGWALGNWLLCEGYLWKVSRNPRFDRARNIETVIRDIAGSAYARSFWKKYRDNYTTAADIKRMAELGYNSVRIPLGWRLFMEDEPGEISFREEGFALLDRCLDWCEEYGLYAFLDLQGAPGGQTGYSTDDSQDNIPRLFVDRDYWNKALALWRRLASRYAERWIVGGYDLLNEPLRPALDSLPDTSRFLPRLIQFYREAAKVIREVDHVHLLSIEGHHWATNTGVFSGKYDDNMVIHFHRYGCPPDVSAYQEYLELSRRLNAPLWLGESGENNNAWYTAMYPLALSLGIGYNLWPWKKMDCRNSPCSVKKPAKWNLLLDYLSGGPKPGKAEAVALLDEYLENMKLANCVENRAVTAAVFRQPPCVVRAADFDALPGKGVSYSGLRTGPSPYRARTGMAFRREEPPAAPPHEGFQRWDTFALELAKGEFASYTVNHLESGDTLTLTFAAAAPTRLSLTQDDLPLGSQRFERGVAKVKVPLKARAESRLTVRVEEGAILLRTLTFGRQRAAENRGQESEK